MAPETVTVTGKPQTAREAPMSEPSPATRPRLLDLFCGAGGAAMGYHRAGFDVVGIDIEPQPSYPFEFIRADAVLVLATLDEFTWAHGDFAAIHASPPCQRYIRSGMFDKSAHPDLLPVVRPLLERAALPWVIENVPGAPMRADVKLCGCMFRLEVRRERWFETSWQEFDLRPPCHHPDPAVGVYGHPRGGRPGETWGWGTFEDWKRAMGIDWMANADEMRLAIPPAYTEHIGRQLLDHLAVTA